MKAVSLFSGAGGFEVGFERAGIETVLQAERDPWALEVLSRHWPETERVTDVRAVSLGHGAGHGTSQCAESEAGAISDGQWRRTTVDLVYGGFPCQDLSVAGKRAGLGGERSGLWFEFHRVLRELRPRWAVIENVPGLLSSNQGRDFAVILDGLDELGFDVAWAILDAQHFGVPQRRRRVFVVAGPSRRSVEQVLSLCEGCGGNPETGRAAGEDLAGTLGAGSADSQRGWRGDLDSAGAYIPIQDAREVEKQQNGLGIGDPGDPGDPMFTIDAASRHAVAGTLGQTLGHHGGALDLDGHGDYPVTAQGVRRLTPLECERLMGWPDDHTRWTADGREIADSHRYRFCGNGVVATVAEWIGHRLVAVDAAASPERGQP